MFEEQTQPSGETTQPGVSDGMEEIVTPRSKYELIMMAAAEATRLNDELRTKSDEDLRRRGIEVEGKITLEALRRVREGKVKVVVQKLMTGPKLEPGMPGELLREGLFFSAPPADHEDEGGEPSEQAPPEEREE